MATHRDDSRRRVDALQHFYYRPARARLDEARAVARDAHTPAAAWEAMAARGLIPFEHVDHPARRYAAARTDAAPDATLPAPPTVAACVAFASDAPGVAAAEELARELARRLAPWGVAAPADVVWLAGREPVRFSRADPGVARVFGALGGLAWRWADRGTSRRTARYARRDRSAARSGAREALGVARSERLRVLYADPAREAAAGVADVAWGAALWDFAREEFLHVSSATAFAHGLPRALVGVRVASLPSPFEALVALYRLGYGLGPITATAIHLATVSPSL